MIRIFLGNVGSGKTISAVKEMIDHKDDKNYPLTYSNIITKNDTARNILLNRDMIISKEVTGTRKNGEEIYKLKFNQEFWEKQKKKHGGFNIILDEAHTLLNSRSAMSKENKILGDFLALIRKIAQDSNGNSNLTLISQLERRLDVIAREMATQIRFHLCMHDKICEKCGTFWFEHNEIPEPLSYCPACGNKELIKKNFRLIVWFFRNIDDYLDFKDLGEQKHYKILRISNIEEYFKFYDTLQLSNLITET